MLIKAEKRFCIIDTPGVNSSLNSNHEKITKKALAEESYDYLVYILNANNLGTDDDLNFIEDEYKFINTADILILFTAHIVKEKNKDLDNWQAVIQAIEIIKPIILEEERKTRKALSTYTKSKNIFEKVKNSAYKS